MKPQLEQAPNYPSLHAEPRLMGIPQPATLAMLLLSIILAVAVKMNILALGAIAAGFTLAMPLARRAFEDEPFLLDLLTGYFAIPDDMPPHGDVTPSPWQDTIRKSLKS